MKKYVLGGALILSLGLTACGPSYETGKYEGQGKGYSPDKKIRLEVTIDDNKEISNVEIVDHGETPELGGVALETLKVDAQELKSADVDIVVGATMTSEGFKEAMNSALEKASNK